jgi:predicted PurR-regulated permease PerM
VSSRAVRSALSMAALVLVTAVLYLGQDVLIPLALAILLSFLLAPAVRQLERGRLGRAPSALIVVLLGFSLIGAIGWVAAQQAVSLAAKLPEYRGNIVAKIRALRGTPEGTLGAAAEAVKDLAKEAAPTQPPLAVTQTPGTPFESLRQLIAPFAKPVGTAIAVLAFTILMLLNRENMRDRLIALIGARRINITTQALGEASHRVSRYLLMQLLVNSAFGIPFGIALHFIGVPNALLWGLLATLLRFIPYIGVWIAVAMPAALAFAISEGWSMLGWTVGAFVVLELALVNLVEPWVYGRSAGLTPIAVIAATVFWTWLWGSVGLLLAMPLTVCVAVIGRYIPELGYLNVLLGVEPVLAPEARFYQRLVAMDQTDAQAVAEQYAAEHGVPALCERVLLPALNLIERDRHEDALGEQRARFIFDTMRGIVDELDLAQTPAPLRPSERVCVVAARDQADHVAGMILGRLLDANDVEGQVMPHPILVAEMLDKVLECGCRVLCISALPPHAAGDAANLCKRLKIRLPELKVVVALWTAEETSRARARLLAAGVDEVVTTVTAAMEAVRRHLATPTSVPQR